MQRMYKRDIAKFQAGTRSLLMAALEKNIRVYKFIKNERIFILKKNNKTVWLRGPRLSISNPVSLWIIKDKHLTKEALKILKIPTPDGYTARTLDEAIAIAKKIKFPLVIKPRRHEGGEGVFLNVDSLPKLEEFFKKKPLLWTRRDFGKRSLRKILPRHHGRQQSRRYTRNEWPFSAWRRNQRYNSAYPQLQQNSPPCIQSYSKNKRYSGIPRLHTEKRPQKESLRAV